MILSSCLLYSAAITSKLSVSIAGGDTTLTVTPTTTGLPAAPAALTVTLVEWRPRDRPEVVKLIATVRGTEPRLPDVGVQ